MSSEVLNVSIYMFRMNVIGKFFSIPHSVTLDFRFTTDGGLGSPACRIGYAPKKQINFFSISSDGHKHFDFL